MSAPRSTPTISPVSQSSISANRAPRRSSTIASRPSVNTLLQLRLATGMARDRVVIIDEDLGLSGSGTVARTGFAGSPPRSRSPTSAWCSASKCPASPATMPIGIDCSISAGLTDTFIGDADGIYHPALFNDRLLLGLKGTISEAELHVLRARLFGGIRNKAARGELRRGLPVGFVWGEAEGSPLPSR